MSEPPNVIGSWSGLRLWMMVRDDAVAAFRRRRDRGGRPCCARAGSTTGPARKAGSSSGSLPRHAAARHAVALANGTRGARAGAAARSASGRATRSSSRRAPSSPRPAASSRRGATPVFADVDRGQPEHHRRDDRAGADAAHQGDHLRPPRRLALRHGSDHDARRARTRLRRDRGLRPGARRHATRAGRSARFGDVGAFSFCQDKIITTGGEGGMVTTDDDALWSRLGPTRTTARAGRRSTSREHPPGFRWLHESVRHELAHDRDAGGDRPDPAAASWPNGSRRGGATRP